MPSVHPTNYTTHPGEFSPTTLIPDMCILFKDTHKLIIFELSVPFETSTSKIHSYNENKCQSLCSDIGSNGFDVELLALEIGTRGYINHDNDKGLNTSTV